MMAGMAAWVESEISVGSNVSLRNVCTKGLVCNKLIVTYLRYRVRNANCSGSRWVCVCVRMVAPLKGVQF